MDDKQIKVKKEDWDLFKEYADKLAKDLNMNISIPNALRHAVKKVQELQNLQELSKAQTVLKK